MKQRRPKTKKQSKPARGKTTPLKKKRVARRQVPRKKLLPATPPPAPAENARAKALAHKVATALSDKKAVDIVVVDVRGKTSYADYLVIASGESDRQVSAMAEHVREKMKAEEGLLPIGTEGGETGHWVLLDYGEVVAHLFYTEARGFYDLDGLWADAPRESVV